MEFIQFKILKLMGNHGSKMTLGVFCISKSIEWSLDDRSQDGTNDWFRGGWIEPPNSGGGGWEEFTVEERGNNVICLKSCHGRATIQEM